VIETFGAGNAPTNPWFVDTLKAAIDRGLIIVNVTQCIGGSVDMGKYETSRELKEIGVIGAKDMTMSSAITKLMFCLGEETTNEQIIKKFLTPWAGEISE